MEFERNFEKGELELIEECNQILGSFNSFYDYYTMLANSLEELKDFIKLIVIPEYRIASLIENKKIIVEINRKIVDFSGIRLLRCSSKYVCGKNSDELKEFEKECYKYYDKYFDYGFHVFDPFNMMFTKEEKENKLNHVLKQKMKHL